MPISLKNSLNKSLTGLLILVILLGLLIALQSCNTLKHREIKALKPYIAVLSDVDTSFNKKKGDLLAAIVDAKMPNKEKTETIIKYLPGVIIKDTDALAKLRDEMANKLQGKRCFTATEMDSIIDYFIDNTPSIYVHDTIVNTTKKTIIDTTVNWKKQQYIEGLNYSLEQQTQRAILAETNLAACAIDLKELSLKQKNLGYLANTFFSEFWHKIRWWLLAAIVLYVGFRVLKSNITFPFLK